MYHSTLIQLASGVGSLTLDSGVAASDYVGPLGDAYVVNATLLAGAANPGFVTAVAVRPHLVHTPWLINVSCVDSAGAPVTACNDTVMISYNDDSDA